ncbi:MAG: 2-C-methyl-D-erythritol 4-phosphate cytidylyltransferase [Candidatus Delongbacteria bacterium]|jgi:2-C-methyl-D-erythritol 4-phosphate cytidylyltransferase|nr:2-C-methyl-D-erythritol 4-phosphate cytidylyltransferase [Candidatus Delongbacteria bacterium]
MKKITAIITAAGSGKRMNSDKRKQYLKLQNKSIIAHTIEVFEKTDSINDIVLVCPEEDIKFVQNDIVRKNDYQKVILVISGGKERQNSVFNALKKVKCRYDDIVLIHDGVRPFVSETSILNSIEAAIEFGAAVVGVKPKNTTKTLRAGAILETLNRDELFSVQTPQTFQFDIIHNSYEKAFEDNFYSTDDSALVEKYADHIQIIPVEGDYFNIKITTEEDLVFANAILEKKL